jgi:homoserine O-acetyltransferase
MLPKGIVEGFVTCLIVILPITATVQAGAPSPRPEVARGPHIPEHQIANLGTFRFANGELVDDFKVSYVTRGHLNETRDNVVLALHCFTQDHHGNDLLIGPSKAVDPGEYFIVAPDFIANSNLRQNLTTGPTNSGLNLAFPTVTMRDSIEADYRLLTEHLGISRVRAAIGVSIGAMKAYQFGVTYPDFVEGIIPIMGSPKTNAQMRSVLLNALGTITLDPGWLGGNYQTNPSAGVTAALMSLSPWWYTTQWYLDELDNRDTYRRWEHMWRDTWTARTPQDARDVSYQMRLWADYDVGMSAGFDGDTVAALASIRAETLLIGVREDLMVRREEMILARDAIPNATYFELDSAYGHAACCGHDPNATTRMHPVIAKFLANLGSE